MESIQKTYNNIDDFVKKQRDALQEEFDAEQLEHEQILSENSPQELQKLGYAITNLCLKSMKQGLYGRHLLCLTHPQYTSKKEMNENITNMVKLPESKISNGDNITIHKEQELNSKYLLQGLVYKKNDFKIVISVNENENVSENQLQNFKLSILLGTNQVTHTRYLKTLDDIYGAYQDNDHHCNELIHTLLNNEMPVRYLAQGKKQIDFSKRKLNQEQQEAISFCLDQCEWPISLIHGPPGTGKTSTVCELISEAASRGMKILACAGSNVAVDGMVERLAKTKISVVRIGHPARMLSTVYEKCLDAQIRKNQNFKQLKDLKKELIRHYQKIDKSLNYGEKKSLKKQIPAFKREIQDMEYLCLNETLQDSQVICCTNAGAADRAFKYSLKKTIFDLVIIDECAQAVEISCWIPILKGKRVVLAGDHKQLPPTVKSNSKVLSLTLFDRILKDYQDVQLKILLKKQYRMNKLIMEWSSQAVYEGELQADQTVENHKLSDIMDKNIKNLNLNYQNEMQLENTILLFMDTAGAQMGESYEIDTKDENKSLNDRNKSKSNVGEADLVYFIYKQLKSQNLYDNEIGIITPYNAQVDTLRKLFAINEITRESKLEISTVDGFQGREKEAIIISMVRSNPMKQVGFLSDYRRMNVAVTRARRFVCLVGDSETISNDKFLKELYEYFLKNGEIRNALEYDKNDEIRFGQGFITKTQQDKNEQKTINKEPKQKKIQNKNKQIIKQQQNVQEEKKEEIQISAEDKRKFEQLFDDDKTSTIEIQVEESKQDLDELQIKYQEILENFVKSKEQQIIFSNIDSQDRQIVHNLAQKMKLEHQNKGGKIKKVHVSKEIKKEQADEQKQQKKQKKNVENKQDEQDEDEFLDELIKQNKFCWFSDTNGKKCNVNVELIGQNCHYCVGRFCVKHSLAEIHGCGEKASFYAKQQFKTQQYDQLYEKKKLKDGEEDFLRKKLQDKIDKAKGERQIKQGDDQKKKKKR